MYSLLAKAPATGALIAALVLTGPALAAGETGACCVDEDCTDDVTELFCNALGGIFQGEGTICQVVFCATPGACCMQDGSCEDGYVEPLCDVFGGTFHSASQCAFVICDAIGACCAPDTACAELPQAFCISLGGTYQGDGTSCADNPCGQPVGACCLPDESCVIDTAQLCGAAGGLYLGDGSDCSEGCPVNCQGDIDGTGDIGFSDLLDILTWWGPCPACPQDVNGDDDVGFLDLLFVLANWGPCP